MFLSVGRYLKVSCPEDGCKAETDFGGGSGAVVCRLQLRKNLGWVPGWMTPSV